MSKNTQTNEVSDPHSIFVRIQPSLYKKASKIKDVRGQSWKIYIERLIAKDKATNAVQE